MHHEGVEGASSDSLSSKWKVGRMERVKISVSGRKFECYKKTLQSKKGSIFFQMEKLQPFYSEARSEYVFDRDYRAFEAILVYFQSGSLNRPENIAFKQFIEELLFFGLREAALAMYKREIYIHSVSLKSAACVEEDEANQSFRLYVYDILERPEKNATARIFSSFATAIIVISIVVYCWSTHPGNSRKVQNHLETIEDACNIWFTVEIAIRFLLCPEKRQFFRNSLNIIDVLSIMPFYVERLFGGENDDVVMFSILRVFRVTRVFRIFKISRYSIAIHVVLLTIRTSIQELSILLFFIFMTMVLFSSLIYLCELENKSPENKFKSIPHSFWLVIVTITTVGYGDMVPLTIGGKLITSFLTVTGIILIALPIPIVVNNFRRIYERLVSKRDEYQFDLEDLSKTSPGANHCQYGDSWQK